MPILIIAFNRPELLIKLIKSIEKFKPNKIYFACDGPRNKTDRKKCQLVKKIIEFFSNLPYIIPGTFFGLGYILAFNDGILTLTGTSLIVILNCIFRQINIGIKAGNSVFTKLNDNLQNAAYEDYDFD